MTRLLRLFVIGILVTANANTNANANAFDPAACHPKLTKSCALYPYRERKSDRGTAPYAAVVQYFKQVSGGLIDENPDSVVQDRNGLQFEFDLGKMRIDPVQDISPETVQKLFRFDVEGFKRKMGASSFDEAKTKYYAQTKFDRVRLDYERAILLFSDWRSLIHPPFFSQPEKLGEGGRSDSPFWGDEYHRAMDAGTSTELTQSNQLRLLVNNVSYFEKLRQIKSAEKYVFVSVMSFDSTPEGLRIIDALTAKAQQGLDVRVIMEKVWGKLSYRKTIKRLRAGGVKVALADDFLRVGRNQGLFHSKYFVVDGVRGVVGGQNLVARSHLATGYNHWNKDLDVRVEGPMVTDMLEDYGKLWKRFTREDLPIEYKRIVLANKEGERLAGLRGSENYTRWLSRKAPGLCRFVSQGPNEDEYKVSKAYYETFVRAQEEVQLTTQIANFEKNPKDEPKWSTKLYDTLKERAGNGVAVRIITNGLDGGFLKPAVKLKTRLGKAYQRALSDVTGYLHTLIRRKKQEILARAPGVEVWHHFQYIHAKTALVDRTVAAVGSYNFETYSAESSYETALFCQDSQLSDELRADMKLTTANSTPLKLTP